MIKTYRGWQGSEANFDEYVQPNDEIDEEMYWHFMETLPPEDSGINWFLMGEAVDEDINGILLYDLHVEKDGRYYFKGPHTITQVDEFVQRGLLLDYVW